MVTVHVTPAGGGTVEFNGTLYTSPISVLDDSKVSFEAIPADGYEFVNWKIVDSTGTYSFSTNSTPYTIACDTSVTANFQEVVNEPPVANAGDDQTVDEGAPVTLDGSDSSDPDGTIASYLWTQTGGTTVTLSDPNFVSPAFKAPPVDAGEIDLTFQLMVTDSGGAG